MEYTEKEMTREFWLEKVMSNEVPAKPNKYAKKKKHTPFNDVLANAPDFIRKDEDLMLLAIDKHKTLVHSVHPDLLADKKFALKYIAQSRYPAIYVFPKHIYEDEEVFYKAYEKDFECYMSLSWQSKKFTTREHICKLLQINGKLIKELHKSYRNDLELAELAIEQDSDNIVYLAKSVSYKLCSDKDFCKKALDKSTEVFPFIHPKLRAKKDFILPYIKKNTRLLEYIPDELKDDKEFMRHFIGDYNFMYHAGSMVKKDEALMLEAVSQIPLQINYIDDSLHNNDFYLKAIKLNPICYLSLRDEAKTEPDLIHHFLLTEEVFINYKEKRTTLSLLPNEIRVECYDEYTQLPNAQFMEYEEFIKKKYLNLYLTNSLNNKENTAKKPKI